MSPTSPTISGWYWYREDGLNLDRPMPVWVFEHSGRIYADLCTVHEPATFRCTRMVTDCPGDWLGKLEPPTA
ncbi:MAG: hypothetical protein H8K09_13355 [Nitrospira sp.]|nr:hypothetical protein [Nitrospira sp.]